VLAAFNADGSLKIQLGTLLLNDGRVDQILTAFPEVMLKENAAVFIQNKQYALAQQFLRELLRRIVP
jgi:hypothetical protein